MRSRRLPGWRSDTDRILRSSPKARKHDGHRADRPCRRAGGHLRPAIECRSLRVARSPPQRDRLALSRHSSLVGSGPPTTALANSLNLGVSAWWPMFPRSRYRSGSTRASCSERAGTINCERARGAAPCSLRSAGAGSYAYLDRSPLRDSLKGPSSRPFGDAKTGVPGSGARCFLAALGCRCDWGRVTFRGGRAM